MNAITWIADPMSKVPPGTERLAGYLRGLALNGKNCVTNMGIIARSLGTSVATVCRWRASLLSTGRLSASWQVYHSIDGLKFGQPIETDADAVKTILRRHYRSVIDPRTVRFPNEVATGMPGELMLEGRLVTWEQAAAMAKLLAERVN